MIPSFRARFICRPHRTEMGSTRTRKSATKLVPVATHSRTRMLAQDPFGNFLFQNYAVGLHVNTTAHGKLIHNAIGIKLMIKAVRRKVRAGKMCR